MLRSLTDTQGNTTTIQVPPDGVTAPVTLVFTPLPYLSHPFSPDLRFAGHAFRIEARRDGVPLESFAFEKPVTVTLQYSDADVEGIDEGWLWLKYWDGAGWADVAETCEPASAYERHPDENRLRVTVCHLSEFALLGKGQYRVYLPLVMREQEATCIAVERVKLTGPEGILPQASASFTATVYPKAAMPPFTYNWLATEQKPVKHVATGLWGTVAFTWAEAGYKAVLVTVENGCGRATSDYHIAAVR